MKKNPLIPHWEKIEVIDTTPNLTNIWRND
jgi:hypothetical protein